MTQYPDLFASLAAPFEGREVKERPQGGRQLHYITARTAMNRLDDVMGPENWWTSFVPGEHSVICRLTLRLPDGTTVTKEDAGGYAGMPDQGDDDKSGFSDGLKRAAVLFGVGRYLYRDGVPRFVRDREPETAAAEPRADASPANGNGNGNGRKNTSTWGGNGARREDSPHQGGRNDSAPRTGRALFAWTKEMEQKHEVGLLKYLNKWAGLQEFPPRMVDWDARQVELAHAEATRKLQSLASGDAYEEALAN
jgi:hypothetical protein